MFPCACFFFDVRVLFLLLFLCIDLMLFFGVFFMATSPTIDSLSKDERKLILASLQLKHASVVRAARAATNEAVAAALQSEASLIDTLSVRFR